MNPELFAAFVVAAVVLVAVPGPNVLFIAGTALGRGRRAGLAAAAGVELATLIYGLATAFGLSVIVAASPAALGLLRLAGAAYLAWLGFTTIRRPAPPLASDPRLGGRRALLDGFWVNLLNPKVMLFFLAFLPQFVDAAAALPVAAQTAVYTLVIVVIGICNSALWVFGVATALGRRDGSRMRWVRRWVVGGFYLALAVLAVSLNIGS